MLWKALSGAKPGEFAPVEFIAWLFSDASFLPYRTLPLSLVCGGLFPGNEGVSGCGKPGSILGTGGDCGCGVWGACDWGAWGEYG